MSARALTVRGRRFIRGERTVVMGILNVTPDSFSGDGRLALDDAVKRAEAQYEAGADIIDIGGESTRPGHLPVSVAEELERVVPVIRAVRERFADWPISIDTYKPEVAREALAAGADCINSVWGASDELLAIAVECDATMAIMHNRERPYDGEIVDEVLRALLAAARRAQERGLPEDRIVLDPGIGFGKTPDQNIEVLASLDRLVALGYPTLLGTSRKSTLGKLAGRDRPEERVFATAATTAIAVAAGIDMVRVHDVAATRDVVAVSDAIVRHWRPRTWTE
ncbi:MAG: dihydropteroate synthase [Candidatus Eremiobacteraeota bacterium]|uniref:dihydropteroate synthase n=1 Tax=mine drainage metagenome TaxID=410659 RepID=E6PIG2_9ZZZZ|nr:dihydropteroate synthase [Candidatus Eremiobacteraeota bacterium]